MVLKRQILAIQDVPVQRRQTLDPRRFKPLRPHHGKGGRKRPFYRLRRSANYQPALAGDSDELSFSAHCHTVT